MKNEKRTASLNLRITPANKQRLEEVAQEAGMSPADLVEWWLLRTENPEHVPLEICIAKEGAGRPKPLRTVLVKPNPMFDPRHTHRYTVLSQRANEPAETLLHTNDWEEAARLCENEADSYLERMGSGFRRYYRVPYDGYPRPVPEFALDPAYWSHEGIFRESDDVYLTE